MEDGLLLFYTIPLLFGAVLGLVLAVIVARVHPGTGSRALAALLVGASLWCVGYAMEFLSPELTGMMFWAKFQYIGIIAVPIAWLVFAVRRQGSSESMNKWVKYLPLFAIIPILTFILVWTNELHGLIWQGVDVTSVGTVDVLEFQHGAWFYLYVAYSYMLILGGSILLIRGAVGSFRAHRWQTIFVLLAAVFPWIGNLIYVTEIGPIDHLDWTPFAFTISGVFFVLSLFRFQLTNVLPIAQRTVFTELADCVLVLDLNDNIVDLNRAARSKFMDTGQSPYGKPVGLIAPMLADWVSRTSIEEVFQVEFSQGEAPDEHFYELRIAPLTGQYSRPIGRLVVCHEITQLKQEQARLEQARLQLEQIVSDRTAELREAVLQLQHELAQRSLAEKRFEEVIEAAPDAMLVVDKVGSITLINAQAERLFGYSRQELLGQNYDRLIPINRRDQHLKRVEKFIANPTTRQISYNLNLSAQRKDGSVFPVEISLGPLNTASGLQVACSVRDISERKKAEEEQNRLLDELIQSHEQLRALTYRLQEVQEIERREIANELHDRVGQNLTGLNLNLQIIENQLNPDAHAAVGRWLEDSLKLVEETTRQVRNVMLDLRPPVLDDYGLVSAINWYCAIYSQRTGIAAQVVGEGIIPRLPRNDEMILFRILQEALNNVAKHARATEVKIIVESSAEAAYIKIFDNGLGFDPRTLETPTGQPHWGLISMQQRAASIGGELTIDTAPDQGTQITVVLHRCRDEN